MGIPVLLIGNSGSGKSCTLRNFKDSEVRIMNVASKPLPFRNVNNLKVANKATYDMIKGVIKNNNCLSYVVDDANLLMVFDNFKRAKELGFNKFIDFACDYESLIRTIIEETSPDTIVYLLQHSETLEDGTVKAKTIGKMLDQNLTVEALFTIVLRANTDGDRYWLETQSNGLTIAKSPMEMFSSKEIDNDLKMVDDTIREYYGLKKNVVNTTKKVKE